MATDLLSHIPSFPGLISPGNIDLDQRPIMNNSDGTFSTVSSTTFDIGDGRVLLIPTIIDGQRVSPLEALEYAKTTGQNLGVFGTQEAADEYDKQMHEAMGWTGKNNNWPEPTSGNTYDFSGIFKHGK